ncbi:MAG: hypothetical protein OXP09_06090 [Gammaproteobacteria bacterium]|nr:hypothetical protein [Rhodospirillaceae bacterium]MDE0365130.1 hypothetical protein [Gammaproteobacteria bacterium]
MNLTITVEDDVLRRARIRALEENTSVNAVLHDYLRAYAGTASGKAAAVRRLLELSRNCRSGRGQSRWTRDELYER